MDRVLSLERGVSIHGQYSIPSLVDGFPASLVAEALGQLAAWAGMETLDFSHRPVAGIAGRIELLSSARPGQELELHAELESVDTDTIVYGGSACVDGEPVLRLLDCVGPMVPVADFDEPEAVRKRWAVLRSGGATPGCFQGLPAVALKPLECAEGRRTRAILEVPASAPFFADHFPRRPVFPGTLLMHAKLQAATALAAQEPAGKAWLPRTVSDVKLRAFIAPGDVLTLEARVMEHSESHLSVAVESRLDQRLVGSAEVQFCPEVRA